MHTNNFNNILNHSLSLLHSDLSNNEKYTFTIEETSSELLELYKFPIYEKYDEYAEIYDYKTIQQKTLMCYNRTFEDSLNNFLYSINLNDSVCAVYRIPFYLYWSVKNSLTLKSLIY